MIWVTHTRATLDGVASAWLLRRFVDRSARFVFVPAEHVGHVAAVVGGRAFDVPGGDYAHRPGAPGEREACTFEVLVSEHRLGADPVLRRLGETVGRVDTGEGSGDDRLATMLLGFLEATRDAERDNHAVLDRALPALDAVYGSLRR